MRQIIIRLDAVPSVKAYPFPRCFDCRTSDRPHCQCFFVALDIDVKLAERTSVVFADRHHSQLVDLSPAVDYFTMVVKNSNTRPPPGADIEVVLNRDRTLPEWVFPDDRRPAKYQKKRKNKKDKKAKRQKRQKVASTSDPAAFAVDANANAKPPAPPEMVFSVGNDFPTQNSAPPLQPLPNHTAPQVTPQQLEAVLPTVADRSDAGGNIPSETRQPNEDVISLN